jgi:predicted AlkP superfamily phosphohydrolase/phosphomutase
VIGWDGADWRILDPLLERGDLPNLAGLIARGGRSTLSAPLPNHSWSAWPSFMTGVDPDDHGVYDILESRGGAERQYPVTFRSIKERTFLADLTEAAITGLYVNIPLTFPPPEVHGKLIAGGVLPKWRPFTHPESLGRELEEAGTPFPINGMSWTTYRNRPDAFLDEVEELCCRRQAATERLLDTTQWQVACVVQVETDRVQHCLAKYVSPDGPDYGRLSSEPLAERVRRVYRLLDEGLGRLVGRTGPEDLVLFMSDHGFRVCTRAVHMDRLLERLGYLEFAASRALFGPMQWGWARAVARKVYDGLGLHGRVPLPQSVNWGKTRAYTSVRSTGEGVSLNIAAREPKGVVDPADFERLRDELAERLTSFVDPDTGARPVARVVRGDELFKGRFAEAAPDLLLDPAEHYSLTHARTVVGRADWMSGDHRVEGVLAAAGPAVDRSAFPESPRLIDLAPTILAAAGAPASIRHAGVVLTSLVGDRAVASARGPAGMPAPAVAGLDDIEADEVEEHLRGLGYLE